MARYAKRRFKRRSFKKRKYFRPRGFRGGHYAVTPYRVRGISSAVPFSSKPGYSSIRQPFPPKLRTVLNYTETINVTQGTTDIPVLYSFSANSLFDPNISGTGNQPRYYDTLLGDNDTNAPYRRYRVHASKITVVAWSTAPSPVSGGNAIISIIPRKSTVQSAGSANEMRERAYSKWVHTTPSGSWKPYKVKNFIKMKIPLGYKDLADSIETSGLYNTNPPDSVIWDINACNVVPSGIVTFTFMVSIKYYVELFTLSDVLDS